LDEEVTRLGLAGLLIEIRQDRVGTKEEAAASPSGWASLAPGPRLPRASLQGIFPSRTGRHV